jgi:hypothetical protein
MEIQYSGKFIEQKEIANNKFNNLLSENLEFKEELEILNNSSSPKKIVTINKIKKLNQSLYDSLPIVFFNNSINHCYNKCKGDWLEDIFKYIIQKIKTFETKDSVTWECNKIHNYFLTKKIKINNKSFRTFDVLYLSNLDNIKKITYRVNLKSLNTFHNNLMKFSDQEPKFKKLIEEIIYTPQIYIEDDQFEIVIKFNDLLPLDLFLNFLEYFNFFAKDSDISKMRTDITYYDKRNKKILILEAKNNECTPLKKNSIYQVIGYGIREYVFSGAKFENLYLVYKGDLTPNLLDEVTIMNLNLKDEYKFQINLINTKEYLDFMKVNYFDDEVNNNYKKKDINCWDLDKIKYTPGHSSDSRKYVPSFLFEKREDDTIIIDTDYEFKHLPLSVEDYIKNIEKHENQKNKETDFEKMGERFFKNE